MKKLLLILLFAFFSLGFSQQNQKVKNSHHTSIKGLSSYPNPFSDQTSITFKSNKKQKVKLEVKNLLGKTVYLYEFSINVGNISLPFYKNDLNSGTYIYSILTDNEVITKRLVIR